MNAPRPIRHNQRPSTETSASPLLIFDTYSFNPCQSAVLPLVKVEILMVTTMI